MGRYRGRESDYTVLFTVRIVCERTWNVIELVQGRVYSEVCEAHLSKRLFLNTVSLVFEAHLSLTKY